MPETILAAVAWPYANSEIHVGNLAGSYLPADIFTRYHRLKGNRVLMVSGTDSHGTPVTVRADAEGVSPLEVYRRYHAGFLDLFQKLGLAYDIFTTTHSSNHYKVSQDIFLSLKENGFLYTQREMQWFSPKLNRFLPDRYVEGTCYICGYTSARSDQCDKCGSLLEPAKLIKPRTRIDNSIPELRETEHFFLDLEKLQEKVVAFLRERESYWRPNVLRQSLGQILAKSLHGRPITRDLDWGIPVPVEGWEGKCLYVWFEAVIGYLSSTIEWSQINGNQDAWRDWWTNPKSKIYYFIGKDNIPFHAIIWPAELIGCSTSFDQKWGAVDPQSFVLPYDVPANEFLNLENQKISGSRNWAVWGLDFLSHYDADALRYYLTSIMPETRDTDWDWEEFYHHNNDELVATWGNLANRVLSFCFKNWDGCVPEPGQLTEADNSLLQQMEHGFETVGNEIATVHLRAALAEAVRLATEVNIYLDKTAPWFTIKQDKAAAGRAIYIALCAIDSLKVLFAPFLPFSSARLHAYLGYTDQLFGEQIVQSQQDDLGEHLTLLYQPGNAIGKWEASQLKPSQVLREPQPLFKKLDEKIVAEERARLGVNKSST